MYAINQLIMHIFCRSYAVVTPTKIRPNQDVIVAATLLNTDLSDTFTITAVIRYLANDKQTDEICGAQHTFTRPGSHSLVLKVCVELL